MGWGEGGVCRHQATGQLGGNISESFILRERLCKFKRRYITTWGDDLKDNKDSHAIFLFENWDCISVNRNVSHKVVSPKNISRQF